MQDLYLKTQNFARSMLKDANYARYRLKNTKLRKI